MQAAIFYKHDSEEATPLFLMTQRQWEQDFEQLPHYEQNCLSIKSFKAKVGEICCINDNEGHLVKVYLGLGEDNQLSALAIAATQLPAGNYLLQQPISHSAKLVWSLAQYRFNQYKKHDSHPRVLVINGNEYEDVLAEAEAIFLVRDLINKPTNDLGPQELSEVLAELAAKNDAQFTEWVGDELINANFPAIHAVGRASAKVPRLLTLSWGDKANPHVTLVGKGVCFDSGGLDIKPSNAMRLMKKDMGGAAHAMALAQWIMVQKLPIYLEVFIPAVENSIGPDAFRPGDVITMRNGLTVEIDNTDAEGRLILADAMVKACENEPELLIDFATLTGAARVAVGTEIAAMFSNNDQLAHDLNESSNAMQDPIWRLPLYAGYESLLDSSVADLANSSGSPYAGAISAALFLQRFIPKSLPWVHFDIMAWNISSKPGKPEGGEAMTLRALAHYLKTRYQN